MANISTNYAFASATIGTDILLNEREAIQPVARTISMLGLVGSAAVGDTEVELRVNGKSEGKFQNTTIGVGATNPGAVAMDKDMKRVNIYVPANARVEAIVTDAPATNNIKLELHFQNSYRSGSKRSYSAGRRTTRTARSGRRTPAGMY